MILLNKLVFVERRNLRMENKMKSYKLGWYLLFVSIGGILGIAVYNMIGWIF